MTHGLGVVSHLEFAIRIVAAFVLGSLIGAERQWRQRNAGLRTNALVATGTSLFVMITPLVGADGTNGNVFQIVSYVVSGIGFLAGGVIFKERLSISGLNTAATLWCTAAIGALVGFGFIIDAIIGVVGIFAANIALRPIARMINQRPIDEAEVVSSYEFRAVCRQENEEQVRSVLINTLKAASLPLIAVYTEAIETGQRTEIVADITISGHAEARLERAVSRMAVTPGVTAVSWRLVPTNDDEQAVMATET